MDKIKNKDEFILGVTTIILSALLFIYSLRYDAVPAMGVGPGFVPKFVAVFSFVCGGVILTRSLAGSDINKKTIIWANVFKVITMVVSTVLYAMLLENVNYVASTSVYLFLMMLLMLPKNINLPNVAKVFLLALAGGFVFNLIFVTLFRVPL